MTANMKITVVWDIAHVSTLLIKAEKSSEMLAHYTQGTLCNIPENSSLENLMFEILTESC